MMAEAGDGKSARIERANRLRAQIERLKSGLPAKRPGRRSSIKEQLDELARGQTPGSTSREK
jgi:hypothetical protein